MGPCRNCDQCFKQNSITVEGNSSDAVKSRSYSLTDTNIKGYGVPSYKIPSTPITLTATPNRTSGTTNDKYSYTVKTSIAASKVTFQFNGNSTLYTINSNGTSNINSGSVTVSSDKKTWVWNNDTLSAGNRTITVTAYGTNGSTAKKSFTINVSDFTVTATPSATSGTTSTNFSYTVKTSMAATKITYQFSGNSTVYTLNSDGSNNFNSGTATISSDKKTWVWKNDRLGAGVRKVTVTAYNSSGATAKTTFTITVT